MSDYISREAVIELLHYNADERCSAVVSDFEAIPAADVEPVVPCKGCEYAERYARTDGTAGYYCGHPQNTFVYGERWDRVFKPVKKPDDFCSYGKRKEKVNV